MPTAAERLHELLEAPSSDRGEIAALLDGASASERLEAVRSLAGTRVQRRLYEAVAGAPAVAVDEIVPPEAPPLREVIYHGKNSLPAFTLFQKRFCRPPAGPAADELWGYNHTGIAWLVGPGYFVCHRVEDGRVAVDYRQVPPSHPPSWPAVKSNARGASFFVYRDMIDYLRRVSAHVLIGSAHRHGKELGSYFVLCRED